jgi:hypothetical protein
MINKKLLIILISVALVSFNVSDKKPFEFKYPKSKGTEINFSSNHFKKFSKEWRGSDYYYMAEADGFVCSVLYYKLTDEEKTSLVDEPKIAIGGLDNSPAYPYSYFKNYSNLKSMERNDFSWGKASDDFMFRQNDIFIGGSNFSQKHMYGYCMYDKDLFVNVHLSKISCSSADSTEMVEMLKSLAKKK